MHWWWALGLAIGEAVAFLTIGRIVYRRTFARLVREADAKARRQFALERLGATASWQIHVCSVTETAHARSPEGVDYFGRVYPHSHSTTDWVRTDGIEVKWQECQVVERAVKAYRRATAMYRER